MSLMFTRFYAFSQILIEKKTDCLIFYVGLFNVCFGYSF